MRIRNIRLVCVLIAGLATLVMMKGSVAAQGKPAQVHANLIQVMRGVLYPASNVVFFAQSNDPAAVPKPKDPSVATDPLQTPYGGWAAVENAGLTMAEGANLLMIPGRKCANGKDVPLARADWPKFVQELRDAGMAAYKAGQSKNMDNVLDAAEKVSNACSNCHEAYREKPAFADRCTP
jgi:hypothetical protein